MSEEEPVAYGDVWLGDLILAVAKTTVGNPRSRREWAMELLGFDESVEVPESQATPEEPVSVEPPQEAPPGEPKPEARIDRAPSPERQRRPLPYRVSSVRPVEEKGESPLWLEEAEPLPPAEKHQVGLRPPLEPLFHPRTTRAILSMAVATPFGDGRIDLDRILEQMTRLRPFTALPRERLPTLRLGIQLLIDRGQGTWPYYRDQERLLRELLDVVGKDRVETLYFADSPLGGLGPESRRTWKKTYEPPAQGVPVVLLTDLGIARRTSEEEWLRFAEQVRSAECPLLALVPYGPARWPESLRGAMRILCWDRRTNVSAVRRTVGYGLEVGSRP